MPSRSGRRPSPLDSLCRRPPCAKWPAQRWPAQRYFRWIAVDASGGRSRRPNVQTAMMAAYANSSIWIKVMAESLSRCHGAWAWSIIARAPRELPPPGCYAASRPRVSRNSSAGTCCSSPRSARQLVRRSLPDALEPIWSQPVAVMAHLCAGRAALSLTQAGLNVIRSSFRVEGSLARTSTG